MGLFKRNRTAAEPRTGPPLDHGQLRLAVLRLLEQRPRTDAEIGTALGSAFGHDIDPARIDRVLLMLELLGYARLGTHVPAFAITADGRAVLAAEWETVSALADAFRAPRRSAPVQVQPGMAGLSRDRPPAAAWRRVPSGGG